MQRYLCFLVADLSLAIPVDQVTEVAPVPPITRIPRPARHIEGLATLRGRTIPVVDLRKRFGLVNPVTSHHTRMIVALPGGRDEPVGFIVDSVGEILSVGEAEGPAPLSVPWVAEGLLAGALEVQGRQVLLPDLAKIADLA
jgi:purine-binding chemotaxis protein CheW